MLFISSSSFIILCFSIIPSVSAKLFTLYFLFIFLYSSYVTYPSSKPTFSQNKKNFSYSSNIISLKSITTTSSFIVNVLFTSSMYIVYVKKTFSLLVINKTPSTSILVKYLILTGLDTIIPSMFNCFNCSFKHLIFSFMNLPP